MTYPHHRPSHLAIRLPSGRILTATVDPDRQPTLLDGLRALHEAKLSLQGRRIATAKASSPPPDGLRTPQQAAARLGMSIKTLREHIASGALRYVSIGKGKHRTRRMFTDSNITAFIASRTRKDEPCPSTASRVRHTGTSTSSGAVIAFTAQPRPRPGGKPKK